MGVIVLILAVHVDDMAVAGLKIEVDKLLVTLNEDFTTVYLGYNLSSRGVRLSRTLRTG